MADMTLTMVPCNAIATGTVPIRLRGTTASQTAIAIESNGPDWNRN